MKIFTKKTLVSIISLVFIILFSLETTFQKFSAKQVHISLGESPGNVTVTWSTRKESESEARFWKKDYWEYFSGKSDLFLDNENLWYIHSVSLNLEPGSRQTFEVGSRKESFSKEFSFEVPAEESPSTFLIFGDLCTYAYGGQTVQEMIHYSEQLKINTVVLLGDMAYDLNSNSSKVGDEFMTSLEPLVSHIPLMVCAGNHDSRDSYYNYLLRFKMPGHKFFYTFTQGFVRFLAIHTEVFFEEWWMLSEMIEYVKLVLNRSEKDRKNHPWLVAFGHRPMYCSSSLGSLNCGEKAKKIRRFLEDLFREYRVDVYFNGHLHNFQRTFPVYDGIAQSSEKSLYKNPNATIYVTTGAVGSNDKNSRPNLKSPPEWFVTGSSNVSFSILNCFNKTHLEFKQIAREDFKVIDQFLIVKEIDSNL